MPDEPTLGEVFRSLSAVEQRLNNRLAELIAASNTKISGEVYEVHRQQLVGDIQELKLNIEKVDQQIKVEKEKRATDRRLIFSALIAPLALLIFQIYLASQGVGG